MYSELHPSCSDCFRYICAIKYRFDSINYNNFYKHITGVGTVVLLEIDFILGWTFHFKRITIKYDEKFHVYAHFPFASMKQV